MNESRKERKNVCRAGQESHSRQLRQYKFMKCSGGGVSRKQRHKLYFSFCAHCWRGSRRNVAEIQEWLLILTSTSVKVMAVAVSRDLSVQVLEDQNTVKLTDRQQYLHDAKQCGQSKCIGVSQVVLGLMIMSYAIPLHFINHTEVVYLGVPWWSGLVFITAGVVAIILDKHCTTRTEDPKVVPGDWVLIKSIKRKNWHSPKWEGPFLFQASLVVNFVSTVVSVIAVITYSVDMDKHPGASCVKNLDGSCNINFYTTGSRWCYRAYPSSHWAVGRGHPELVANHACFWDAGRNWRARRKPTQARGEHENSKTLLTRGLKSFLLLFTMAQTTVSATLCFQLYRLKYTFGLYSLTKLPRTIRPGKESLGSMASFFTEAASSTSRTLA
ncbi:transmembrane protein 176 isoform X2 [Syngnathus scovelli]|uniref:transmembrane protein 176 isoform X2 n=1 Tax=Syngnathus scovelli TaxID=161590 RepID=UPI0035CAAAAA